MAQNLACYVSCYAQKYRFQLLEATLKMQESEMRDWKMREKKKYGTSCDIYILHVYISQVARTVLTAISNDQIVDTQTIHTNFLLANG